MGGWNHNIHYHHIALRATPADCNRVLDVGCGQGLFARKLAQYCREVIAIDSDRTTLDRGNSLSGLEPRIRLVEGDVMTYPLCEGSFDLVTAIAVLHHLPLRSALVRFRQLLRPGGILVVIGLYRLHLLEDYAFAAAAVPTSWMIRLLRGRAEVDAPLQEPSETLREIRAACNDLLPGGKFRRHLLFRYSFIWRKP
jgi:SAM-dependent methyltransferase